MSEGQSPIQELEVGTPSRPYLLFNFNWFIELRFSTKLVSEGGMVDWGLRENLFTVERWRSKVFTYFLSYSWCASHPPWVLQYAIILIIRAAMVIIRGIPGLGCNKAWPPPSLHYC